MRFAKDKLMRATREGRRVSAVIDIACRIYGVERDMLLSRKRSPKFAEPRMAAMFACRSVLAMDLADIGHWFDRHHSTVMHACSVMEDASDGDGVHRMRLAIVLEETRARIFKEAKSYHGGIHARRA